jgi:hypothetical protein
VSETAKRKRRKKVAAKPAATKPKTGSKHKHRVPGKTASPASIGNLVGAVKKQSKAKPKKKSDKPVVVLDGLAAKLLLLQQSKAEFNVLKGRIASLESDLLPAAEKKRMEVCQAQQAYIGSIHVQATGDDGCGKAVNAGQAMYYVQNKYKTFDPSDASTDDDLQEEFDGAATIRHEAIQAIADALDIEWEDAEAKFDERVEIHHGFALDEGVLATNADGTPVFPEIIAVLQKYLTEHLVMTSKAKPTKGFHEQSSYKQEDIAIMQALNELDLCVRYKPTMKPSGAPRAAL